jgi:hypothetical protein
MTNQQGNQTMTKHLTLAASAMMLLAIAGQASARTAAPNTPHWSEPAATSDRPMVHAATIQTAEPNAHRYEGGPKSND